MEFDRGKVELVITHKYLLENPDHVFVFGDNTVHEGKGGAAKLRDLPNTYGFITKCLPCNGEDCYYDCPEYEPIYKREIEKLISEIESNPGKLYLISKIGSGLANQFMIFENIIEPNIKKQLGAYDNARFLW